PLELHLLEEDVAFDPNRGIVRPRTPAAPPSPQRLAREKLARELAQPPAGPSDDLLQFVRRSSVQTYTALDRLRKVLDDDGRHTGRFNPSTGERLAADLPHVARPIPPTFCPRHCYVRIHRLHPRTDPR